MQTQTLERSIRYDHGDYKMTLDGRVIGWARSYHEAETTLNEVVHEMLTHGDCATAEELDGDTETIPEGATCQCRLCIQLATHRVNGTLACCFHYSEELTGVLCGCTDDDYGDAMAEQAMGAYNGNTPTLASWSTATASAVPPGTPPGDDLPDDIPPNPAPKRFDAPAALALQTLLATQQQGLCLNCGEKHRTWACPEIARKLFAPDALDALVYETHELVRLWGASRSLLAIKLARLTPGQLTSQAAAFAAWLNKQTQANLPARSVLHVWQELIGECDPALERVA